MAKVTRAVLVDTHVVLWLRINPRLLRQNERDVIAAASVRYISMVSIWEIAILMGLGRAPPDHALLGPPEGFDLLSIGLDHCVAYAQLPRHHRDPFDRMLLAQAQTENVPLLTRDRMMAAYGGLVTLLP
jgi:PIN domain nuclease of toxin-antitoxin system